jgi:hypothetical protein
VKKLINYPGIEIGFLITLIISLILSGCEKNKTDISDYNTAAGIKSDTISSKNDTISVVTDQLETGKIICNNTDPNYPTTVNQNAFCLSLAGSIANIIVPEGILSSESEVKGVITDYVTQNPCTGIKNSKELTFINIQQNRLIGDNGWLAYTSNQMVDSVEVDNTSIFFRIKNKTVIECKGNWFPEIYIPKEFNISKEKALSLLAGKTVSFYSWGGKHTVTLESVNLSKSDLKLIILPITVGYKTTLRVTWEVDVPAPVLYLIYIDVMTGEVIRMGPSVYY